MPKHSVDAAAVARQETQFLAALETRPIPVDALLDDVRAHCGHGLGKEPSRRPFARFGLADQPPAAGQPRHHRRADGALQVENRVVAARPQRRA